MPKVADVASGKERTKEVGISRENSDRAFYKELVKVIEASDVIVEVLDARDPLGTRCADMEKMVLKLGPEKHIVLLLNKIDLVPREAVEKWLKYLREELPAVAFKCSTQQQRSNYGWKSASKSAKPNNLLQTSDCLGAETLIKLLKNYSRSYEIWFDQVRYKAASGITFDRLQVVEGRSTYSISRHGAYRFTSEITNLSLKDTYTQEELDVIRLEIFRFIQYNGEFEPSVVSLLGFDPFQLRFGVWSHHFF